MIEFKLPSLGADMDEGKLLEWKVKPGDAVKKGDVVAVVDTTKAAVEVETWQEGTVQKLLVEPGTTMPVGTVIALFLAPGEKPGEAPAPEPARVAPAAAPQAAAPAAPVAAAPSEVAPPGGRRPVSPAARRRARRTRHRPGRRFRAPGPTAR